jgi:hypothetical protein
MEGVELGRHDERTVVLHLVADEEARRRRTSDDNKLGGGAHGERALQRVRVSAASQGNDQRVTEGVEELGASIRRARTCGNAVGE